MTLGSPIAMESAGLGPQNSAPLIVDVKRYSLSDGPGIRSVVFFKGCPLRCSFCQNPETQVPGAEVSYSASKCVECGRCVKACPSGAAALEAPGRIIRDRCTRCGACAEECPSGALRRIGSPYTPEALAGVLLRDRAYYQASGGGVTLSGGEPTSYLEYAESLLRLLKEANTHTALETCGYFRYDEFRRRMLPYLDLVYFDVKLADPDAHRKHTGRTNDLILQNLRRLVREGTVEVRPRMPLVPGITANRRNLSAMADLLCDMGAPTMCLLPYNPMGIQMAVCLGRPRPPPPERFMRPQEERDIYAMFEGILAKKEPLDWRRLGD